MRSPFDVQKFRDAQEHVNAVTLLQQQIEDRISEAVTRSKEGKTWSFESGAVRLSFSIDKHHFVIQDIFVHPERRGEGIARDIVSECVVPLAERLGVDVQAYMVEDAAISFWVDELGFEPDGHGNYYLPSSMESSRV